MRFQAGHGLASSRKLGYAPLQCALDGSVSQHCVRDFYKAPNIRAPNVVDPALFLPVLHALAMDVLHDAVEVLIHLLPGPGDP